MYARDGLGIFYPNVTSSQATSACFSARAGERRLGEADRLANTKGTLIFGASCDALACGGAGGAKAYKTKEQWHMFLATA